MVDFTVTGRRRQPESLSFTLRSCRSTTARTGTGGCVLKSTFRDPFHRMLLELAFRFRLGILRSDPSTSSLASLRDFPRGACADASLLLAKYLQVNKCGSSLFVLGKRHGQRHAWLQLEQFIIDITADQFDDKDEGVIVTKESSWHSSFNGNIHGVADFCLYDPNTVFQLSRAYQAITYRL